MLKIEVKTGGAAFADPVTGERDEAYEGYELCRILKEVEYGIENGRHCGKLYDINGNRVGEWSW